MLNVHTMIMSRMIRGVCNDQLLLSSKTFIPNHGGVEVVFKYVSEVLGYKDTVGWGAPHGL